jgi:hypothetical protein
MKQTQQSEKFKEAARELETGDDEGRWEERLKRIAKHKQAPDSPEHKTVGDETKNPLPDEAEAGNPPSP